MSPAPLLPLLLSYLFWCCCRETCLCPASFLPGAHPDVALRRARDQPGARRCCAKEARASLISIPKPTPTEVWSMFYGFISSNAFVYLQQAL